MATDGLWEVMAVEEVAQFVAAWRRRPWPGWSCADALTLEAQERWKLLQPEARPGGPRPPLPARKPLFDRSGNGAETQNQVDWRQAAEQLAAE